MKDYGSFDILGPIMIGPSSSHTAGAARLGKVSMEIAGEGFYGVDFFLHGSFAMTYKGHGTDKALVAGILGFSPDSPQLKDSFDIASKNNIEINFIKEDLGYVHPNSVKILFKYKDKEDFFVTGSSIGGGNIVIHNINGNSVEFTGNKSTLILKYNDRKGVVRDVATILAEDGLNIATLKVSRENNIATLVSELDSNVSEKAQKEIASLEYITYSNIINVGE